MRYSRGIRNFIACVMTLVLLLQLLPVITVHSETPYSPNLLANCSFETTTPNSNIDVVSASGKSGIWNNASPNGWTTWVNAGELAYYANEAVFHAGDKSIKVVSNPNNTLTSRGVIGQNIAASNFTMLQSYTASVCVKMSSDSNFPAFLRITNGNGVQLTSSNATFANASDNWLRLIVQFTYQGSGNVNFELVLNNGTIGTVWFDSVVLESDTVPLMPAGNLLANGSFESGTANANVDVATSPNSPLTWNTITPAGWGGWSQSSPDSGACLGLYGGITEESFFDSSSIKIIANPGITDSTSEPAKWPRVLVSQKVTADKLGAGKTYKASVWVKTTKTNFNTTLRVICGGSTYESPAVTGTTGWSFLTFDVPYTDGDIEFLLVTHNAVTSVSSGIIYFDGAILIEKTIPVTGVILNKPTLSLIAGSEETLNATVSPENATDKTVSWISSNMDVAEVDSNGKVYALLAGTATITAMSNSDNTKQAVCEVSVINEPVAPSDIHMQNTLNLYKDDVVALPYTILPADATDVEVQWESGNQSAADVDNSGKVTAVDPGIAEITARMTNFPNIFSTCDVYVLTNLFANGGFERGLNSAQIPEGWYSYTSNGPGVAYSLDTENFTNGGKSLKIESDIQSRVYLYQQYIPVTGNTSYRLTAKVKTENFNSATGFNLKIFFFKTPDGNNPDGETAKFGLIRDENTNGWKDIDETFLLPDTTNYVGIQARYDDAAGTVWLDDVRLMPWISVHKIMLDSHIEYMEKNSSRALTYSLIPALNDDSTVLWSTSNPEVATVDNNGVITGISAGEAYITATAVNGKKSDVCKFVIVDALIPLTDISLPLEKSMAEGQRQTLIPVYTPSVATIKDVSWQSSNEEVVSVSENGDIMALKSGTATITITSKADSSITAICNVSVNKSEDIIPQECQLETPYGKLLTGNFSNYVLNNTGTALKYSLITSPAAGVIEVEEDGSFRYNPRLDFSGTISFKAAVQNESSSAVLDVTLVVGTLADAMSSYASGGRKTIYFTQEKLDELRPQIQTGGARFKQWEMLEKQLLLLLNTNPPPYSEADIYHEWQRAVGDNTVNLLMGYLLTGDERYRAAAVNWAMASVHYPYWEVWEYGRDSDLPAGHQLHSVGLVYNWLYDYLSTEQREAMRAKLFKIGRAMYSKAQIFNWFWTEGYLQNHMYVALGGLTTAALSLYAGAAPEEQEELQTWIAYAHMKLSKVKDYLPTDGSSHEGVSYWEYGTEWLIKSYLLNREALGIDMFSDNQWLSETTNYILYHMLSRNNWTIPVNRLNFGDSPTSSWYGPSYLLRIFAAEYRNQSAQWLAARIEDANIDNSISQWMSVIWMDPALAEATPDELATMHCFDDMGIVISRTDWSGDEGILAFKAGPYVGKNAVLINDTNPPIDWGGAHVHPDTNSFLLYDNGEYLLKDDGYAYKYTSQHSTLLVDGKGQMGEGKQWFDAYLVQSLKALPEIVLAENNSDYDFMIGAGAEAYDPNIGLEKYNRALLYLKNQNVLIVLDDIKAASDKNFELRYFPSSVNIAEQYGIYTTYSDRNTMRFTPLTTEEVTTAAENVTIYDRNNLPGQTKAFTQKKISSTWQNAVAFSWSTPGEMPESVRYQSGGNNIFEFEVEGVIYSINLNTYTVATRAGSIAVPDGEGQDDATLSNIFFNGGNMASFDKDTYSYMVEKFWKTPELSVLPVASYANADINVSWDQRLNTPLVISCISYDGSDTKTYTINFIDNGLLAIEDVEVDIERDGFPLEWLFDSDANTLWSRVGLPVITFDLGSIKKLSQISVLFNLTHLRTNYFDLDASVDSIKWENIVNDGAFEQQAAENIWMDLETGIQARYIRIKLRAHSLANKDDANAYCAIKEVSFFGQGTYRVTFHKNGGDSDAKPSAKYVEAGDNAGVLPAAPTRTGYTFAEWNTEADGSGQVFTAEMSISSDLTVYAQWTADTVDEGDNGEHEDNHTPAVPADDKPETKTTINSNIVTGTLTLTAAVAGNGTVNAEVTQAQADHMISKAVEEGRQNGEGTEIRIEIKVDAPMDADIVEVSIPKAAINQAADNSIGAMAIVTPVAYISFDNKALHNLSGTVTGKVKITASKVEVSSLSSELQKALADRPVFNFSVTDGDKIISQFGGNVSVAVPYTPKQGEEANAIVIYYISAEGILNVVGNCLYESATGSVTFNTDHFSHYAVGYNKVAFNDVNAAEWYSEAVTFIAARGITLGTGKGIFGPQVSLSRAEFIVMLMRAFGIKEDTGIRDNFSDAGNTYYTGYLAAAKRLGISAGIGNNLFAPDNKITRQEMCTLLYNACKVIGQQPEGRVEKHLADFIDSEMIALWAIDSMKLMVETGVIRGSGNMLLPEGTTTRAEMAQVLYNLLSRYRISK